MGEGSGHILSNDRISELVWMDRIIYEKLQKG
jgi:hypothetical protein